MREEQPFAVDDRDDRIPIADDQPLEPVLNLSRARPDEVPIAGARRSIQPVLVVAAALAEKGRGQRRAEDQRDQHRQGHRGDDRDRELLVDHAGRAAEKGHRQEDRRQDHRDRDQRDLDLLHRFDRRFARGHAGILVHQPLDILDHHDRVIDEQTDRQHQPEQGQRVDGEAGRCRTPRRCRAGRPGRRWPG